MNRDMCHVSEESLVNFTDDALTDEEAAKVREHIEQCLHCRRMVEALGRSLEVTQMIWKDNPRHGSGAWALPSHKWRYAAVAAVIALTAVAAFFRPARHKPAPDTPTLTEIENHIARSGTAARLLAASDLLDTQDSLQETAQSQYRHILEKYPDTGAAKSAHLKLESLR